MKSQHEGHKTTVIAVCGKGGVGKTSVTAAIVRLLSKDTDKKVLAIDADPAVGLSAALGVEVTKTVDDVRLDLINRLKKEGETDKQQMLSRLDYELFSTLSENGNTAFMAIGRPEKKGCYCQVNSILKDIIASIIHNFDFVIIDGEAGIEQVNRRVMESVTHLILISDASARGLQVTQTISKVADTAISFQKSGLILNKIRGAEEQSLINLPKNLTYLGWIPDDEQIRNCDIRGDSILLLEDCPAIKSTERCLKSIGLTM